MNHSKHVYYHFRHGVNRFLTAYKSEGSTLVNRDASIDLLVVSQRHIVSLLEKNGVTEKERRELQLSDKPDCEGGLSDGRELQCTTGRLNSIIPQVPQESNMSNQSAQELLGFRKSLPIWKMKGQIMSAITENSVVMITGDTGCGKTTQVPQFILEHSHFAEQNCRILAAEPRRLAALAVAERVAQERGEAVGQIVGYQIRLESR